MAATTGQLGLVTPTQGDLSGVWGDTVNNGITEYTNIAIAGTLTLTGDGAVTLANTTGNNSASNITSTLTGAGTVTAQFAIVRVTGTLTVAKVVTGPSYSKTYTVVNAATGGIVTFKASGQTGVSVAVGESAFVYFNGTDYVKLVGTATAGAAGGSNTQVQFNSSGILAGSANMTFNGTTLTVNDLTDSSLTATRVVFAGTAGNLTDSANLTWDGTTLSSTQVNITGQGTLRLQDTTGGEYVGLRSPSALGASYTLTFPADDGTSGQALITDGSGVLSWSTAASGDVYGPGSSTDNAVARFDSTTGKLLQNSVVIIDDTGAVTGVTDLSASGSVTLSGGTANGVTYLNGSKVLTSGSALTYDGTKLNVIGSASNQVNFSVTALSSDLFRVQPQASGTGVYLQVTDYAQTVYAPMGFYATAFTFNADATINGVKVGRGAGAVSTNTAVGATALSANTTGDAQVAVGYEALKNNVGGYYNTAVGYSASRDNISGFQNAAYGFGALLVNQSGANNTAIGFNALAANLASNNTALGYRAGILNNTGTFNCFVGDSAGQSVTSGQANTIVGSTSGTTTNGSGNTLIGYSTIAANTSAASNNTAVGCYALRANTSGTFNTAIGGGEYGVDYGALGYNTIGSNNTAVGHYASRNNVNGNNNTSVGFQALFLNTASGTNTAVGVQAGYYTSSDQNSFLGYRAGFNVSTGVANVAVGYNTMAVGTGTTGNYNTAVGGDSLQTVTSGSWNSAFGKNALIVNNSGTGNTAVGGSALGGNTTASYNTAIGYECLVSNSIGLYNTGVGVEAGHKLGTNAAGNSNTAIGYQALYWAQTTSAHNTAIGFQALNSTSGNSFNSCTAIGSSALKLNTSGDNTAVGFNALASSTSAFGLAAFGYSAASSSTANRTTALGYQAGINITTGGYNTAVGSGSMVGLSTTITGTDNVSIGSWHDGVVEGPMAYLNSGSYNVAVGNAALKGDPTNKITGSYNVAIGQDALGGNFSTGGVNTGIGYYAGYALTTGSANTFVGKSAGSNLTTGDYNLYVGFGTQASGTNVGYELVVATTNTTATGKGSSTGFISAGGAGGIYNGSNSTTWATTSDERIKKNIVANNQGLEKVLAIPVFNFEYRLPEEITELAPTDAIAKEGVQLGTIAQKILAAGLPECVKTESTGVMSVNTDPLIWYLVNSVKQLSAEVESLKSQLKGA